jgi:hypothetical protein
MPWKNLYHPNYQDQNLHIHGSPLKSEDLLTGKIRLGIKARKTNNQKDRDQYRKLKTLAQKTATCVG